VTKPETKWARGIIVSNDFKPDTNWNIGN